MKIPTTIQLTRTCLLSSYGLLASTLFGNTSTWTQTTTDGTYVWSDSGNWDAIPATNGDDLIFNELSAGADITSEVDGSWSSSGAVNSMTFASSSSSGTYTIDTGSNTLSIGAGGITNNLTNSAFGSVTLLGTLDIAANQTWYQASSSWNRGMLNINSDLTGTGNIEITGALGGAVFFWAGSSDGYDGSFTLESGGIRLLGNSQLNRLGSNALTWNSTGASKNVITTISISNLSGADQAMSFDTPIHFVDTGSVRRSFNIAPQTTGDSSLAFTGAWTGELNDNLSFISSSDSTLIRFQQDASTLTTTSVASTQANGAVALRQGKYLIESANAFGAGNSFAISLGDWGTSSAAVAQTSLYTSDGIDVASDLTINRNWRNAVDTARSPLVKVGLMDEGTAATFSGDIDLEQTNYNADETAFNKNRESNLHLTAAADSTVTFSGDIADRNAVVEGSRYVPVIIEGGGTVIISGANNNYRGGTSVIGGATLVANGGSTSGSATGLGSLWVGYDGDTVTGTTTTGESYITGIADTSKLHVGQSISGTGIADGTVITWIHPTIAGRIEISQGATANGSVSLSASAETGVLGGSGVIKPGTVNAVDQSIIVANGSSVAPGDGIGTLILDGSDTSASLLTMASGATFDFELGAANTSDEIALWNYVAGDFVLNDNVINFTGAQEGEYLLFSFYEDVGGTMVASGITDGLVVGTGLEGFSYNLNYNTNSITLSVIPEPSAYVLSAMLFAMAFCLRRRLRTCN